jgi:hypothetical protein
MPRGCPQTDVLICLDWGVRVELGPVPIVGRGFRWERETQSSNPRCGSPWRSTRTNGDHRTAEVGEVESWPVAAALVSAFNDLRTGLYAASEREAG